MTIMRGFLALALTTAVFGAAFAIGKIIWAQAQIKIRVPFTTTIEQHVYRATPHVVLNTTDVVTKMFVAFKSDGAKSHAVYQPDGSLPMVQIRIDVFRIV